MEPIKHECGVAMIRLLKPLDFYKKKYGTSLYGLNKLYLLMEKQHNRGQEAAGIGCVKMDVAPGNEYIFRERAEGSSAIQTIFESAHKAIEAAVANGDETLPFEGEVYMGHLRYSTTGRSGLSYVHPFMRRNNWSARNLLLCGNFNMTNVDEIFDEITGTGQHPRLYADTFILLEQIGHGLDRENERLFEIYRDKGQKGLELASSIAKDLNVANVLRRCSPSWDGGYVICGIVGNGDLWAMRDPKGIRPAFYYADDEVVVVASERPVIQTAFNLGREQVRELEPGSALIVDRDSSWRVEQILEPAGNARCSFERIYFSRGSDADIYKERKELGRLLTPEVLSAIDYNLDNTVFSFIPNTAEVAFYGLIDGLDEYLSRTKVDKLKELFRQDSSPEDSIIHEILFHKVRREKIAWKDIKLRTFIAQGDSRDDLASHVYDITYDLIRPGIDNLVVLDDSIVRGTTLKQSIIRILDRLSPRKIVIVSSAPQVRYPDCYGIDMSRMGEFIAFRAAIELLKLRGMTELIDSVYEKCKTQENKPKEECVNYVKEIYLPFSYGEISDQIAKMLTPEDTKARVQIVYQSLDDMHKAIPDNPGDWYFSGNYPTPGGNCLVSHAFINFYEGHELAR